MTPLTKTIKILKANGFYLVRRGSGHDIYRNDQSKITIPLKRHDFNENDMKYVLKEAGLKSERK